MPQDLRSVFSAGFILILMSIVCPDVVIDDSCIAKADEILSWMHSKGNGLADCRRSELVELQAASKKINASFSQSFDPRTPGQDASWLWDALDIDGGAMHLNLAESSMNLTSNDARILTMFLDGEAVT